MLVNGPNELNIWPKVDTPTDANQRLDYEMVYFTPYAMCI